MLPIFRQKLLPSSLNKTLLSQPYFSQCISFATSQPIVLRGNSVVQPCTCWPSVRNIHLPHEGGKPKAWQVLLFATQQSFIGKQSWPSLGRWMENLVLMRMAIFGMYVGIFKCLYLPYICIPERTRKFLRTQLKKDTVVLEIWTCQYMLDSEMVVRKKRMQIRDHRKNWITHATCLSGKGCWSFILQRAMTL